LYLIFLLILFEGLARLCFIIPPISNRLMYEEDSTWRRIWIARHMDQTEVFYSFDALDPTKGWKSEPNMRDLAVFDQKILNTNSRGLRGKKDFSYDRDPNKLRILILGDSFTFGDEVSDNETYSYYLQKMLPNAEIINMGVHGYGHDQMLIYLEEEGVKYKPDIFIILLAVEMFIIGVALIVLIIQLASLSNLLQNEVKPILDSTTETVNDLKGTVKFLSDNVTEPVIKLYQSMAGINRLLQMFKIKK